MSSRAVTRGSGPARRATISDVSREAGVSRATVSRVMNGRGTVDPAITARVLEVAKQLDYSPSRVARGLSLGRTNVIGLVVPDLSNPTFQGVLLGLTKAAGDNEYRVLVADSRENPEDEVALAMETRSRCDALILCSPRMSDEELAATAMSAAPTVLINRTLPGTGVSSVRTDHEAGVTALIEHLYELGHRKILYLGGPERSHAHQERLRAIEAAQDRHADLKVRTKQAGSSLADGYKISSELGSIKETALVAFNDLIALSVMDGLREQGVNVPGDISVVGFGNIPFSRLSNPQLTTVTTSEESLGRHAWERLKAALNGNDPEEDITLLPRLIVRESSAPPRA